MKIVFVHNTRAIPYAEALVKGYKKMETRSRNTLDKLIGEEVMIARTMDGKQAMIVGTVVFDKGIKVPYREFREIMNEHLVPEGSKFDCKPNEFKWCYEVVKCQAYEQPKPLPKNLIRHGRVWAEIKEDIK